MDAERCVCCGVIIPEGRQVCPQCEAKYVRGKRSMMGVYDDYCDVDLNDDTDEYDKTKNSLHFEKYKVIGDE